MKKIVFFLIFCFSNVLFAQKVTFNKIENVIQNSDDFLYRITETPSEADFLAELSVLTSLGKEEETFALIYDRAKEIGANAFLYKPFETIDESEAAFNPNHFILNFYYIPKASFPHEVPSLYLIGGKKKQTIRVNEKDYEVLPNSYFKIELQEEKVYEISTKKFLGTTLKFNADKQSKYIMCEPFKIKPNDGLSFKSGDLVSLQKSYADFLSLFYKKLKN